MDFSEYLRRLGAEPRSRDEALARARDAGPEFREAAEAAERFERLLERALEVSPPPGLVEELRALPGQAERPRLRRPGWPAALAAGLMIAAGAWLLQSRLSGPGWDSVEDYVVAHYRHDGPQVLGRADGVEPERLSAMLADFGLAGTAELSRSVRLVKYCPTPDGEGLHLVLDSPQGLVTVIYMPYAAVADPETLAFDDREALLVPLPRGSAAIIGTPVQQLANLYPLVQDSLQPQAAPGSG